ncbi:protein translocase subunit SecDF [Pseudochryseolinea flava]|uniref:Multifunctional fusion protein n=1 Tax=Pseudochryseolinea flava TaxID=2059302 RepID=A0A364Y6V9_9BACT|nr:protein translocase subunit SecDF [Pseudochryseolinea flava]RAW02791.1 protein translocase subunit SecDF [Pseudochryseolinea flava]
MQNKGLVVFLSVVTTIWCFYMFSFTVVSYRVQSKAVAAATDKDGNIDLLKKQKYLDSVWTAPVYNFLGIEYTYKEVKDYELSLGLDLQGGMHVTLEISPADIIRSLAANNQDSAFNNALKTASLQAKSSTKSYSTLFFNAYQKENPGRRLASIFNNASTKGMISSTDTDADVIAAVEKSIESAISRSYTIISNRLDKFGTSQPTVQILPGTGRIQVEIPGADNPQRVRKLLQGVAKLEFWDVVEVGQNPQLMNALAQINKIVVDEAKAAKKTTATAASDSSSNENLSSLLGADSTATGNDSTATKGLDSLTNTDTSPLYALNVGMNSLRYQLKDTAQINDIFRKPRVRALIPRNIGIFWANKADKNYPGMPEALDLYFLELGRKGEARLDGSSITYAKEDIDDKGRHAVSMSMNATGTRTWAGWTEEAANKNPQGRIAIMLDNVVFSAPVVNTKIPNGQSVISGNFTLEEAKDLASVLQAGSLPVPTKIVEETSVGPTLGAESIRNGIISIIVGFLIIILFMFVVYNASGWVADLAVILNLIFLLGILASLNAALTLPGIAGILLSLAIAVDANVLINERVKEDINSGKGMDVSLRAGYKGAFTAIIDSNVTTLIKGFVLLVFGSGLIYGFAVTLIIGILCSFFTSVFFTRVIFEYYIRRGKNISFSQGWSKNLFRSININFIGNRKIYYTISSAIIVAGIALVSIQGFNFGVDFKGGRTYVVGFEKSLTSNEIRETLSKNFPGSLEVKSYGGNAKYKITTDFLIDDDSDDATAKAEQQLTGGLASFAGNKATILSSYKVGPTIANDIKINAVVSLLVAVVLMFLYILVRFRKWQFALGTIVSLFHTVFVLLALFILLEPIMPFTMEIDQAFVAAILTVIGYSINDSVVVFDRVREFLAGKKSNESTAFVVNNALNDTLSRTLITGMSTIFVILILFIFGGESIKGFTFAMLIGVLIGTYSSLCIGTPVLVDFSKEDLKQPDNKPTANKAVTA